MEMKKFVAMLFVGIMLLSLVPLALADEGNETSDEDVCVEDSDCDADEFCDAGECADLESEDEAETEIMRTPYGASVRLVQLERAIENNIAHGERIVDAILANDENADVDELNRILDDMRVLVLEVQNLDLENKTPQELAEEYVEIKSSARELAKEFRTQAREFFTKEDADALRARLRDWKSDKEEQLKARFEETREKYNAEKLRNLLRRLGVEDEELIEEVIAGATNLGEAKKFVQIHAEKAAKEVKVKAVKEFKEDKERAEVFMRAAALNAQVRIEQRLREHVEIQENGQGPEMGAERLRARAEIES